MPEHTPAPTPSRAVYGFAMYLSFKTFFLVYMIWAVTPESWFEFIGFTDMPRRYWAVSVPIFLLTVLTTFAFIIYPSLGLCMTPNIDDLRTIKENANVGSKKKDAKEFFSFADDKQERCCENDGTCGKKEYDKVKGSFASKSIPPLEDINVLDVSKHLYLNRS